MKLDIRKRKAVKRIAAMSMTCLSVLFLMGCGSSGGGSETSDDKKVFVNAAENMNYELEDSRSTDQPMDTMTVSEQISTLIMEQVQIVMVEEKGDSAVVRITYPQAGDRLVELLDQYGEGGADMAMAALRDELQGGRVRMETLETTVEYADPASKTIQWTENVVDAMSGGMYHISQGQ